MSLVGGLLEQAARATPAAVEDRSSGWWLRHTDGRAWWSGAVSRMMRRTAAVSPNGLLPPSGSMPSSSRARRAPLGRAVANDGWTGVFGMVTAPQARRQGAARLVLAAIACWAGEQGAPRLYLQVERSNTSAARLYEATGFTEIATYHYRVRDVAAWDDLACRGSSGDLG